MASGYPTEMTDLQKFAWAKQCLPPFWVACRQNCQFSEGLLYPRATPQSGAAAGAIAFEIEELVWYNGHLHSASNSLRQQVHVPLDKT